MTSFASVTDPFQLSFPILSDIKVNDGNKNPFFILVKEIQERSAFTGQRQRFTLERLD